MPFDEKKQLLQCCLAAGHGRSLPDAEGRAESQKQKGLRKSANPFKFWLR